MTIADVLRNDARLIRRDMILGMMLIFVVYIGIVLRFGLPWLDGYLLNARILPNARHPQAFSDYIPAIISLLNIYTGPILGGSVFGLLMLTEKDEETMKALLVSPLSPGTYVGYRILLTSVVSLLIVLFLFYTVGQDLLPFGQLLSIAFGAALVAPLTLLFLMIVANGRVQGMNYSKFFSFGGYITLVSWWVSDPAQLLFGLFPPYWISKAYWAALEGSGLWWVFLVIGITYQGACILLLWRIFIRRICHSV